MTDPILIALHTLTYRLRGMESHEEKIHKPIYWLVCIVMLLPIMSWWAAAIIGSAFYYASRPSLGEQYGKVLGNDNLDFDTDWITDNLVPFTWRENKLLWAHTAMFTRGLWYCIPMALLSLVTASYWLILLAPFIYYVGYVGGAYFYHFVFKKPLIHCWIGGEYGFGLLLAVSMVI